MRLIYCHSLNRREEEFTTKRAFDDFLEQREEIITNLTLGTDVVETEEKIRKYASQNTASIRANQALEAQEATSFQEQQSHQQEEARLRRAVAREEYEMEQRELLKSHEDVLARLAAAKPRDAEAIAKQGSKDRVLLKKSSARRSELDKIRQKQAALRGEDHDSDNKSAAAASGESAGGGLVKGLKKQITKPTATTEEGKPYDPFGGLVPNKHDYYTLRDSYPSSYLENARQDVPTQAGGYDLREYYSRTLLEAFAGLGCFVDQEVSQRSVPMVPGPT